MQRKRLAVGERRTFIDHLKKGSGYGCCHPDCGQTARFNFVFEARFSFVDRLEGGFPSCISPRCIKVAQKHCRALGAIADQRPGN